MLKLVEALPLRVSEASCQRIRVQAQLSVVLCKLSVRVWTVWETLEGIDNPKFNNQLTSRTCSITRNFWTLALTRALTNQWWLISWMKDRSLNSSSNSRRLNKRVRLSTSLVRRIKNFNSNNNQSNNSNNKIKKANQKKKLRNNPKNDYQIIESYIKTGFNNSFP